MSDDLPRTPVSALLQTRLGMERGLAAGDLLRGTGLSLAELERPETEVSARQELSIIGNLVDGLDDPPGLGLVAGARYHLTAYGLWSFMLISSPTPRSAVDIALRYVDLTFAFCRIDARERDGEFHLVLNADDLPARLRRFAIEREAAAIATIQREAFGDRLQPLRVDLAFPAPSEPAPEGSPLVEPAPSYDAAENVLAYDAAHLDAPIPQANEQAAALARTQCNELLQRRRARTGLAGRTRDLIAARIADAPDAAEVAAALNLSGRTLQRRLAEEGTSFRALVAEVREQLAEEFLTTGGLPVAEVAHRLGYVEVSSFSQAFRRWKGVGPGAFRARRSLVASW